ncbi:MULTISPECIES: hypothetical protein [Rhodococcus]|uniref:hypothetical protein n=1 Tax=Rhodococcus TaxID=1827 RepID=UPI0002FC7E5E|nr:MULTISPECIES: hypothetical protein [Rhodococcus]
MSAVTGGPGTDVRLAQLIDAIDDVDQQGIPLRTSDYLWLVAITVMIPALLMVIGAVS